MTTEEDIDRVKMQHGYSHADVWRAGLVCLCALIAVAVIIGAVIARVVL